MKNAIAAALYFIAANLTGAHYYNSHEDTFSRNLEAIYAGAGWPIYWSARAAIAVTD